MKKTAKEEERKKTAEEANDSKWIFRALLDEIDRESWTEKESGKEKLSENDGVSEKKLGGKEKGRMKS